MKYRKYAGREGENSDTRQLAGEGEGEGEFLVVLKTKISRC